MQAHANDLRSEVEQDWRSVVEQTGEAAPKRADWDDFVHGAVDDWRALRLQPGVAMLMEYAEKVTQSPATCRRGDVDRLRAVGWSDTAIHDAVQVVAYFNYINRIADALGVEPEAGLPQWGRDQHGSQHAFM